MWICARFSELIDPFWFRHWGILWQNKMRIISVHLGTFGSVNFFRIAIKVDKWKRWREWERETVGNMKIRSSNACSDISLPRLLQMKKMKLLCDVCKFGSYCTCRYGSNLHFNAISQSHNTFFGGSEIQYRFFNDLMQAMLFSVCVVSLYQLFWLFYAHDCCKDLPKSNTINYNQATGLGLMLITTSPLRAV